MNLKLSVLLGLVFLLTSSFKGKFSKEEKLSINLKEMKIIGEVDERYQSVNIEMCEVVGGDFWIPYGLVDPKR